MLAHRSIEVHFQALAGVVRANMVIRCGEPSNAETFVRRGAHYRGDSVWRKIVKEYALIERPGLLQSANRFA